MVRQKDKFWEYAEDLKGRFVCKFCHRDYPGGIARVKSHLSRVQGRDIAICNSVPEDVRALALTALRGKEFPYKKRKTSAHSPKVEGNGVDLSSSLVTSCPGSSTKLHQTTLLAVSNKKDKELVDKLVAQALIMNNIAVDAIQSPSFTAMVEAIAEFGAGYSLPSCTTLCTKLFKDARTVVKDYVSTVKGSWSLTGCTLMSDIWSDTDNHSFINIVAYSPKGAVFIKSFEKTDDRDIEAYLGDRLLSIINEIGAENVVQIVVNDASGDECSADLIVERYPHIYRTQCASRGMQLLLEDIYKEVEWIRRVCDDGKLIVDYIYEHPALMKLLRAQTGDKELKRPSETVYASHFLILQSVLEVEENLRSMVVSPEWNDVNDVKSPVEEKVVEIIQSVDFWSQGKEVISALDSLVRVLCLVDGEGSTAGYLYEAMEKVRLELGQLCLSDSVKYSKLLQLFVSRRDGNIVHKIHAAAAFLNPSLMFDGKIKYEQPDTRDGMNYILESMVAPDEMDDFAAQLLLYSGKSSKLFNTLSVVMMKKAHPRIWWEYYGGDVPLLRKVAIRILSQPCSSSLCQRGAFEVAQTKMINKVSQDVLEDLIYTRMNTKMMTIYSDLEVQDKFAINLEKLGELPAGNHDCGRGLDKVEGNIGGLGDMSMPENTHDRGSSSPQLPNSVSDFSS